MKTLAFTVLAVTLLAGCAGNRPRNDAAMIPAEAAAPPPVPEDGAIYAANSGLALFEDQKAHRIGDLITVLLVEKTNAEKKANTSTAKKTSAGVDGPKILGRPVTANGTPILDLDIGSDQSFAGGGGSSQSNALSGSITVVVNRVLPNGNLVIRGEKNLRINQGNETITLEGIVRPVDVATSNTVTSDRIANARIAYGGSGSVADANAMGWLARFFNSALFPF